jgi:hypothetical protein
VVQEVVGLRLQRVASRRRDRISELGVLVAVVELAHAHIARAVHLTVVRRTVVDANALEIELAGGGYENTWAIGILDSWN